MPRTSLYDRLFYYLNRHSVRGKDRLYTLFQKLGFKKLIVSKTKYGLFINANPYEHIDSIVIKEGFYESEVTEELLKRLSPGDTFWDIGANIGLHSLAVKKQLPNVDVVCFEPNPISSSLLISNVELNALQIEVCQFPLFNKPEIISLHLVEGNSGMATLIPYDELGFKSTVKCQTVTGNYLIEEGFKVPAVIKIDIEGAEIQVLNGCDQFLISPLCKAIVIEADNNMLVNKDSSEMVTFMASFGFGKIEILERNENTHHPLSNFIFFK